MRIVIAGVITLLFLVTPAVADERTVEDRKGDSAGLDILSASHSHARVKNRFIHTVVLSEPWESNILGDSGDRDAFIDVLFDTRRNEGYQDYSHVTERWVGIRYEKGELRAELYNNLGDPPKHLASLNVWRPSDKAVAFSISKRQLKSGELDFYEWGAFTYYAERGNEECNNRHSCIDEAPSRKRGYLRHNI